MTHRSQRRHQDFPSTIERTNAHYTESRFDLSKDGREETRRGKECPAFGVSYVDGELTAEVVPSDPPEFLESFEDGENVRDKLAVTTNNNMGHEDGSKSDSEQYTRASLPVTPLYRSRSFSPGSEGSLPSTVHSAEHEEISSDEIIGPWTPRISQKEYRLIVSKYSSSGASLNVDDAQFDMTQESNCSSEEFTGCGSNSDDTTVIRTEGGGGKSGSEDGGDFSEEDGDEGGLPNSEITVEPLPVSTDPFREHQNMELETAIVEEMRWGRSPEVYSEAPRLVNKQKDQSGNRGEKTKGGGVREVNKERLKVHIEPRRRRQQLRSRGNANSSSITKELGGDDGNLQDKEREKDTENCGDVVDNNAVDDFWGSAPMNGPRSGGWFRRRSPCPTTRRIGPGRSSVRGAQIHHASPGTSQGWVEDEIQVSGESGLDEPSPFESFEPEHDLGSLGCFHSFAEVHSFLFSNYSAEMSMKKYERTLQRMTTCVHVAASDISSEDGGFGEEGGDSGHANGVVRTLNRTAGPLEMPRVQSMDRREVERSAGSDVSSIWRRTTSVDHCRACAEVNLRNFRRVSNTLGFCSPRIGPTSPTAHSGVRTVPRTRSNIT